MDELKINRKFKDLIPPLADDEYVNLRDSLKNEGCRDAIVVWNGTIIDGHNRYAICTELGISFQTLEREFESEDEAVAWVMFNQLARRNVSDVERGRLALRLKECIAARARKNCSLGGGDKKSESAKSGLANLPNPILSMNTRKELATQADIGERTLAKIEKVDKEAPALIREAMGKTISIDMAAQLNARLKQVPEIERDNLANLYLTAQYKEEFSKAKREEKIAKIVHNMVSAASNNYEYLTGDCVDIYLKRSPSSIANIIKDIDYEISLKIKLKNMFQRLARPQNGSKGVSNE